MKKEWKKGYHLTNHKSFTFNFEYENKQQEMGRGLYVTIQEDVEIWDRLLRRQKYVVVLDLSKARIIHERDFPKESEMAKDLMKHGYDAKKINALKPKGDTFGRSAISIVTKREWAKLQGYDGIEPFLDEKEGRQVVLFSGQHITLLQVMTMEEFLEYKRKGKL